MKRQKRISLDGREIQFHSYYGDGVSRRIKLNCEYRRVLIKRKTKWKTILLKVIIKKKNPRDSFSFFLNYLLRRVYRNELWVAIGFSKRAKRLRDGFVFDAME